LHEIKCHLSDFVNDCCLAPNEQFVSYIMVRISYIRSDYYDVCFAIDHGNMLSWEF